MAQHVHIARLLRRQQTGPEEVLWAQLRARRLDGWKFRRQAPLLGYVPDFYCAEARLTIELDGVQHAEMQEDDARRRRVLEANGLLELRFSNAEIKERLPWVIGEIRRALDIARAGAPRPAEPRWR